MNKKDINELHIYDLIKPKNNDYMFENFFNENDNFDLPEFENLINQISIEVSYQPFIMRENSKGFIDFTRCNKFFFSE